MLRFLSEDNILMHKEYVRTKKLRYSILEKSIPGLSGKNVNEVIAMRLTPRDKSDALDLLSDISLHELFFDSFCDTQYGASAMVRKSYGADGSFLNELYKNCLDLEYGFAVVTYTGRGVCIYAAKDYIPVFELGTPILAVDVCEHSYFSDYGFAKDKYLINALPYLDVSKIDKIAGQNL